MKRLVKNNSGFTLIEIIVVLIIVGILAAISMQNLFGNVTKSKAQDAMQAWLGYRPGLESCMYRFAGGLAAQAACNLPGVYIPTSTYANFAFTPATAEPGDVVDQYTVVASDKNKPANTITWRRASTGIITCAGAGDWANLC